MKPRQEFELDKWVSRWPYDGHKGYDWKIANLAASLHPEKWSYDGKSDYKILTDYIKYTFEKLYSEHLEATEEMKSKILFESEDKACFNTGLFDTNWQQIFFYCEKNRNEGYQRWWFHSFQTEYTLALLGIKAADIRRANYFSEPSDLVFNVNYEIIPQWDHILDNEENFKRLPSNIALLGKETCRAIIKGKIDETTKIIQANYKTAVPQWYNKKIQLLIPLYLTSGTRPDVAMVLSKNDATRQYSGHTCLTRDMAYNNARLIARPNSEWLDPL
ncbi:MAG: DUF3825 domain-containing protein [Oscillospiraceae bacterium]|nr:DUF3825 domain-containing protein [Oscillospiraceae bacterium]